MSRALIGGPINSFTIFDLLLIISLCALWQISSWLFYFSFEQVSDLPAVFVGGKIGGRLTYFWFSIFGLSFFFLDRIYRIYINFEQIGGRLTYFWFSIYGLKFLFLRQDIHGFIQIFIFFFKPCLPYEITHSFLNCSISHGVNRC